MKLTFKRPPDFGNMGRKVERDIRGFLTVRLVTGLREYQREIMENTPVYTGRTLINYRWSIGQPSEDRRRAIANPALPGKTSNLSIGQEPRRAANQAVVQAEFEQVINVLLRTLNPYVHVFLNNNVENFSDVEYGTYSQNSRTPPGGMTRRGEQKLQMIIKGISRGG